jgi:S-adenosylmethionine decarboxylase proenzyme
VIFSRAAVDPARLPKEVSELNTRGRHLLVEYTGCAASALDDLKRIEQLMNQAVRAAGATVVASVFQPFEPHGVSGVVVIEESHISIHTWPEHGYAAVDFYTCGQADPEVANALLQAGLGATHTESMYVDRGLGVPGGNLRLRSHRADSLVVPEGVLAAEQVAEEPSALAN